MKLRREARTLKAKALCSLRRAVTAFNTCDEDGRITCVLLHMQHAAEMLLKAVLVQKRVSVFDRVTRRSIGFEKCVNLAMQHAKLTQDEAGLLRAVDSLRDAEQHWLVTVPEDLLYLHARGFVTIFDDILKRTLADNLANHLPGRVLPVSTMPPIGFDLLVDREFSRIRELLAPGTRRKDDARSLIRTLLALESHVSADVDLSEADIDRAETAIRGGKLRSDVFPRLGGLQTQVIGEGISVEVRITKKDNDALPVRLVSADDPQEAAAIREVDLQRIFHISATKLAQLLKVSPNASFKLREKLGIDKDPKCRHVFKFGKSSHPQWSQVALERMRAALAEKASPTKTEVKAA